MKTYSEKLRDPRWQKRRLAILNRDEFTCQYCYDHTTELHVHHKKYNGNPWEAEDDHLITVCKYCHLVCEAIKNFSEDVCLYKIKKCTGHHGLHLVAFASDKEYRWVIFYYVEDGNIQYLHAVTEGIVKHIHNELYPPKKKK